jgi:hypothetical protein
MSLEVMENGLLTLEKSAVNLEKELESALILEKGPHCEMLAAQDQPMSCSRVSINDVSFSARCRLLPERAQVRLNVESIPGGPSSHGLLIDTPDPRSPIVAGRSDVRPIG